MGALVAAEMKTAALGSLTVFFFFVFKRSSRFKIAPHPDFCFPTFVRRPRRLRHGAVAPERPLRVRERLLQLHVGVETEKRRKKSEK